MGCKISLHNNTKRGKTLKPIACVPPPGDRASPFDSTPTTGDGQSTGTLLTEDPVLRSRHAVVPLSVKSCSDEGSDEDEVCVFYCHLKKLVVGQDPRLYNLPSKS